MFQKCFQNVSKMYAQSSSNFDNGTTFRIACLNDFDLNFLYGHYIICIDMRNWPCMWIMKRVHQHEAWLALINTKKNMYIHIFWSFSWSINEAMNNSCIDCLEFNPGNNSDFFCLTIFSRSSLYFGAFRYWRSPLCRSSWHATNKGTGLFPASVRWQ